MGFKPKGGGGGGRNGVDCRLCPSPLVETCSDLTKSAPLCITFQHNFYFYFQGPSVGAANIPSIPQTGLPYYNPEAKGQLILKGRFGVFKSTKKPTKFL